MPQSHMNGIKAAENSAQNKLSQILGLVTKFTTRIAILKDTVIISSSSNSPLWDHMHRLTPTGQSTL